MKKSMSPYIRPSKCTEENGVDVNLYGFSAVYSMPPELTDEHIIQKDNDNIAKIKLKKSSEISGNYLGVCTTRMPRTPETDVNSLSVFNLIDGNTESCWSSRSHIRKNEAPVWVRIDLAKETAIEKIIIRKRPITFERHMYNGSFLPSGEAREIGRAYHYQNIKGCT